MIIDKIDLDCIFQAAQRKGFVSSEVYCEASYHASVQIQGKIEDVRLTHSGGAALRCSTGKAMYHFSTPNASTEAILRLLDDGSEQGGDNAPSPAAEAPFFEKVGQNFAKLSQLARGTWSDGQGIRFPRIQYDEWFKHFEVADSRGMRNQGREEAAHVGAHWTIERGSTPHRFSAERARHSIDGLFQEIAQGGLFRENVKRSLASLAPWPAPSGNIPVMWSARALSKLLLQFLRAFEGDLVLNNLSFLTELDFPIRLPFVIEDVPDPERLPCDNEGSPTRKILVFDEGRPKALACNNSVAEQLNVPSTGHCRRESYLAPPTVGFWTPRLRPYQVVENPIQLMPWGLSVRDLEIVRYEPATGDLQLRLHDVALVHQGAEGEPVEPIELNIHLLHVLKSLVLFSDKCPTSAFPVTKHGQRFLTEVSAPVGVSESIPIPGRVPLQNYW